uniref:Putative ovule protein n=1 Tax=Solanum chacoense TaxID=4108 RepID=A0A0V0H9J9_SOLCH
MERFYIHPLFICRHLNISSHFFRSLLLTTTMSWEMKTHQIALTLDLYILSHSVEFHILKDLIPL